MGSFAAGYASGVSTPGRYSSIGQALNQLLQMGFQTSERKGAEAHAAGQLETRGKQEMAQIGATGEQSRMTQDVANQGQLARDEAKRAAQKQAAADLAAAYKAMANLPPGHKKAVLQEEIKMLDKNGDGIPDAVQTPGGQIGSAMVPGLVGGPMGAAQALGESVTPTLPPAGPSAATPPGSAAMPTWNELDPLQRLELSSKAEDAGYSAGMVENAIKDWRSEKDPAALLNAMRKGDTKAGDLFTAMIDTTVAITTATDNAKLNSLDGIGKQAEVLQKLATDAEDNYFKAQKNEGGMTFEIMGENGKPAARYGSGGGKLSADQQKVAVEYYGRLRDVRVKAYNGFLDENKEALKRLPRMPDSVTASPEASGKTFDRLVRKGGQTYRLFTDGTTELVK